MLNVTLSLVATLTVPLFWVNAMFLPASAVTVLPGLTKWLLLPEISPAEAVVFRVKPELLIAFATFAAVA